MVHSSANVKEKDGRGGVQPGRETWVVQHITTDKLAMRVANSSLERAIGVKMVLKWC